MTATNEELDEIDRKNDHEKQIHLYRKKPVVINAKRITKTMTVETLEGAA